MKTTHLFEEHVYLISNHSVARNPMFASSALQNYFTDKMEKYLSPISEIIAYCLYENEFQLLVKLKTRVKFCEHYKSKQKEPMIDDEIPESTYIFSQAMANLQVSFVKHFNYKYQRSGTLVARRFHRQLVESEMEMNELIKSMNAAKKRHQYSAMWVNDLMKGGAAATSEWIYRAEGDEKRMNLKYLNGYNADLGASFEILPPYQLPSSKNFFLHQILKIFRQNSSPKE